MARIALFSVTPQSFGGGYETFLREFTAYCVMSGHDADIITPPRATFKRVVSLLGLGKRFAHLEAAADGLADYGERLRRADAVYVKNELLDLVWLRSVASPRALTVGFHTRLKTGPMLRDALYASPLYRALLRGARLHFVDTSSAEGFPDAASIVVPNGVAFPEAPMIQAAPKTASARILFAGRLSSEKGSDRLPSIVAAMPAEYELCIAGDGPDRAIAEHLSGARVAWLGRIERSAMPTLYRSADILVLPSRWEIVPFSLIEAVSQGVVPLCQDIPPLRALMGKWPELLCDFDDPSSISRGLRYARDFRLSGGFRDLFESFRNSYSSEVVYSRLLDFMLDRNPQTPKQKEN